MGNVYYRQQFLADLEEAFNMGEICFPEWDALIRSWPSQIEAVYYANDLCPEDMEPLEACGCLNYARDEAEDRGELSEKDWMYARDALKDCNPVDEDWYKDGDEDQCDPLPFGMIPLQEQYRDYMFSCGTTIRVEAAIGLLECDEGNHCLKTPDGEITWIKSCFLACVIRP